MNVLDHFFESLIPSGVKAHDFNDQLTTNVTHDK